MANNKGRAVTGDEKQLVLFQALLNQNYSVDDICVLLNLDKDFFTRNSLRINEGRTVLIESIKKAIEIKSKEVSTPKDNMKFIHSHQDNIEIFEDTIDFITESDYLMDAVKNTIDKQFIWNEDEEFPKAFDVRSSTNSSIKVFTSGKRTFEAAERYAREGKKVAVLNFANNHSVGGGVVWGANAQEECLCCCSTLYPCISSDIPMKNFYERHSDLFDEGVLDNLANGDLIYSPDIVVCKTDTANPERYEQKDFYKVDVITCAAPNLQGLFDYDKKRLFEIHKKRFGRIIEVAEKEGVEVLILGAFGCGAFYNDPEIVAKAAKAAISEIKGNLERIEFAVFATNRDSINYEKFSAVFGTESEI